MEMPRPIAGESSYVTGLKQELAAWKAKAEQLKAIIEYQEEMLADLRARIREDRNGR